jgi:membrane fusion protein (multidrug efflux system)
MSQVETPPRGRQVEPAVRESPTIVPGPIAAKQPRSIVRMVLLILGPGAALAVLGWLYFSGGRYVTEENAYVGASTVATAPQVAGQVSQINVTQNQHVDAQQVLFVIDPEPYQIAVDGARAQLGITRSQILAQIATWQADEQLAKQAEVNLTFAQQELARMQQLVGRATATQEQLDQARRNAETAAAALAQAQAQARAALAQIGGDGNIPVEQRPQYLAALAQLQAAERNLRLTQVKAPFGGIVTNVNAIAVGSFLAAGQQAMSFVDSDHSWVDANLRETDLTYVKPGDPATVAIDAYPDLTFRGAVQTINPASGAVFALIPPQKATGNWVKVVQRIPVRVAVQTGPASPVLRDGMSATVTIDSGHRRTFATLWRDIREWF